MCHFFRDSRRDETSEDNAVSTIVYDCPRCGASKITFDVFGQTYRSTRHNWQNWYEVFCVCRSCQGSTVLVIGLAQYDQREHLYKANGIVSYQGDLTKIFEIDGYISLKDRHSISLPDHLPTEILSAFKEGASCFGIGCFNAASTMFRLCLDLATKPLLPSIEDVEASKPNEKQRRDLGLRLRWLLDNNLLPQDLAELAKCIREDANDGAHAGSLSREDAEDIVDFTRALLERLITEPAKLKLAEERRAARRKK